MSTPTRKSDRRFRDQKIDKAADALLDLYPYGGDFLASVFEAGWLTEYERNAFHKLATALRERDTSAVAS